MKYHSCVVCSFLNFFVTQNFTRVSLLLVCLDVCVQSDANKRDKKKVEIYQLMMDLLRYEEQCASNVRRSESEVEQTLADRLREELTTELSVSIYDTQRNDQAKRHRLMLVRTYRVAQNKIPHQTICNIFATSGQILKILEAV